MRQSTPKLSKRYPSNRTRFTFRNNYESTQHIAINYETIKNMLIEKIWFRFGIKWNAVSSSKTSIYATNIYAFTNLIPTF